MNKLLTVLYEENQLYPKATDTDEWSLGTNLLVILCCFIW